MTTTAPQPTFGDGLNSPRLDGAFSSQPRRALILLGTAMILQPVAGSLAIVWLTGGYGIVFGALMLAAGIQGRRPVIVEDAFLA